MLGDHSIATSVVVLAKETVEVQLFLCQGAGSAAADICADPFSGMDPFAAGLMGGARETDEQIQARMAQQASPEAPALPSSSVKLALAPT